MAPARLVFTCVWHRIHFTLISAGAALFGVGYWVEWYWLAILGFSIALPSAICIYLVFLLGIPLAILSIIMDAYRRRPNDPRDGPMLFLSLETSCDETAA